MPKLPSTKVSRRKLLGGAAAGTAALPVLHQLVPHQGLHDALEGEDALAQAHEHAVAHRGAVHVGAVGSVDPRVNGFDPAEILRDFDEGTVRGGVREWDVVAEEKEIEVAPGVGYAAWTYNGRVPGPTLRAREGERLRINFTNGTRHPHTMHFHGIHVAAMDGVPGVGIGNVAPGRSAVYEFDATPFGVHLYHCHTTPLAEHIAKGLYGAFVIDPKEPRPPADELVMVMNGFDTNFDRSNEVYAVNTVAFEYMNRPVRVSRGELVRIYLVNVLEFDLVNSFHFPYEGKYMFHAHVSEFAELGWMGFFEVTA
jgi:FtsP/CotA-like multicopper oxidase with cupredoxin domain